MMRKVYLLAILTCVILIVFNIPIVSQGWDTDYKPGYLDSLNSAHLNSMEFRRFDKSKDGLISRKEYDDLNQSAKEVYSLNSLESEDGFNLMDLNTDNSLSPQEFEFRYVRDTISWPGRTYYNVPYKQIKGQPLLLDILLPTNPRYEKAPVLYFVHGGGFRSGAKEYLRLNDLRAETALQFAENGFCCVSLSYSFVTITPDEDTVLIKDCVTDAWDGLRFLKQNAEFFGIDADKIIVWGESAGGHIAQMLTLSNPKDFPGDPDLYSVKIRPAAGISWYGASDFTGLLDQDDLNSPKSRHYRHITGKRSNSDEDIETLKKVSPYYYLNQTNPPLLLLQGDSDHAVSVNHVLKMYKKGKELGAMIEMQLVKNAGHNWRQVGDPIEPSKSQLRNQMLEFGRRTLALTEEKRKTSR